MSEEPHELAACTWLEARDLFQGAPVALLPIGSTAAHGPHLPLGTDLTIAEAVAEAVLCELRREEVRALVLPGLAYGLTRSSDGFAGSIGLRPGTLWAIVEDVVESLQEQGVRRLVLCNALFEAEHLRILEGLAADFPARGEEHLQVLLPEGAKGSLSELAEGDDVHAGRLETALMLAAQPGGVREEMRLKLEPRFLDHMEEVRCGSRSLIKAGAAEAYLGDPAAASAAQGGALLERIVARIVASIRASWPELFTKGRER
jgi:creatinine amidohydrolase